MLFPREARAPRQGQTTAAGLLAVGCCAFSTAVIIVRLLRVGCSTVSEGARSSMKQRLCARSVDLVFCALSLTRGVSARGLLSSIVGSVDNAVVRLTRSDRRAS